MNLISDLLLPLGGSLISSLFDDGSTNLKQEGPNKDLSYPTDFNLTELTLSSSTLNRNIGGKLDLRPYLIELNYFEDIFDNSVSGKLVLSDAVGIFKLGGLNGTETINMEFNSGVGGIIIKQKLHVYSVTDRHTDNSLNFENYTLNLCSEELIAAEKYRISKSYKKKAINQIIDDILKNHLKTNKNISIEPTMGSYDFVLPNKKIYETINWLSMYAQPSQSKVGADMLFYENCVGLNFKSLQTLYTQKPVYTFVYNPKNVATNMGVKTSNIYRIQVMNNFDTLGATSKGTLNNRLIALDPLTRKKVTQDFNYEEYKKNSKSMNKKDVTDINSSSSSDYKDKQGKKLYESPPENLESGPLRLMVTNSTQSKLQQIKNTPGSVQNDYFIERYLPNRIAQLFLSQYNRIKILVPGNSNLKIGDTVNIRIYETIPLNNEKNQKGEDVYLNGKYLITAIRHIINVTRYTTVIELSKESIA